MVKYWLHLGLFVATLLGQTSRAGEPPGADPSGEEFFEKQVRPILSDNCFECHGGEKKHKGNLRLDSRQGLLKGGDSGPAIIPGQPSQSLLVKAIGYQDAELRMPPRSKLPGDKIAILSRWIEMGAPWPNTTIAKKSERDAQSWTIAERARHWAFQPIQSVSPPAVRRSDWPLVAIDRFILAGLEAKGLEPAPPAEKRTWIRRVTYDLIGLPPTPAEVEAYLADHGTAAEEKVVDRLLAEPAYGERWARHWLDLVRYAETCGHEYDFDLPEAFEYRDYVIRALNADVPFDQFVREHVAGDLLARPRLHPTEHFNESIIGTGFFFMGEAKHSPVDIKVDQADRYDNEIDVFSKTFLGLTVACARCHDHKFDPIRSGDYYGLYGYLDSSRFQRAWLDDRQASRAVIDELERGHARARELATAVSTSWLEEHLDHLAETLLAGRLSGTFSPDLKQLVVLLIGKGGSSAGQKDRKQEAFSVHRQELAAILAKEIEQARAVRAGAISFTNFGKGSFGEWSATGDAFGCRPTDGVDVIVRPGNAKAVALLVAPGVAHSGLVAGKLTGALRSPTFTITRPCIWYHASGSRGRISLIIDGFQRIREPIYGGLTVPLNSMDRPTWLRQDVSMWQGERAYIEVIDDGPGDVSLDEVLFTGAGGSPRSTNPLLAGLIADQASESPEALAGKYQQLLKEIVEEWRAGSLGRAADARERIELLNDLLASELLGSTEKAKESSSKEMALLQQLLARQKELETKLPHQRAVMAMADGTGENERIHIRGNPRKPGQEASRRFLEVLGGKGQPKPAKGSGRLALAEQMLATTDPLLPRVMVNRIWEHHFGEGLVRSPDNFGVLGERPSNPELLDYLATDFVKSGWSQKRLHRQIVLSQTYRMASRPDAKADEADPGNRLLHRMPIRRLEAEAVRDAILAVSGRLDSRMYGPSVLPHLTAFMDGRGRPQSGPLDGKGRRSIYISVRRNFLTPMFLAFDYPIPFSTMGRRTVSTVPSQALALLNNPFVEEEGRAWAKRVLAEKGLTDQQRVGRMMERAFGRPPTEGETTDAMDFLQEQARLHGAREDQRAWADLAHVLFNVKEFIFIN
jgi:hypothetical protein